MKVPRETIIANSTSSGTHKIHTYFAALCVTSQVEFDATPVHPLPCLESLIFTHLHAKIEIRPGAEHMIDSILQSRTAYANPANVTRPRAHE